MYTKIILKYILWYSDIIILYYCTISFNTLYDKTITNVQLCIWDKQPILIKNLKNKKNFLKHEIKFSEKKKKINLKVHIYYKLLLGIIRNVVSWNEVQNHCLFERKPNKYDPDTIFWLNLYKY